MKNYFVLILTLALLVGCNTTRQVKFIEQNKSTVTEYSMKVTHYYSVKNAEAYPERDTLKNCFACNQGLVVDANGKELEKRFYKENMQDMFAFETYRYNDQNQKIGSNYYVNDTLISSYTYALDAEGKITTGKAFDINTDTLNYGYINAYDEIGNHISTGNLNSKGEVYEYYVRKFNENNVAIEEDIEDLEGNSIFNVKYAYRPKADKNWVEQLTYYNDNLKEIRYREVLPVSELLR